MNNVNNEYYVFDANTAYDTYADTTLTSGAAQKKKKAFVENPEPMKYVVAKYSKGKLADTHSGLVVSDAIAAKLQGLKNVQLIPATIEDKKKVVHEGYNFVNCYNILNVCDMEASVYSYSDFIQAISLFEKIVLKDELSELPLDDRLMFKLTYADGYYFVHQSIMDKILETKPKSAYFGKVSEYGKGQYWE